MLPACCWQSLPSSPLYLIFASDGQLEINQACAVNTGCFPGDDPGFPVTITQPGSYRLTGNLDLSAVIRVWMVSTSARRQ
jgi:hypothetical protein